jgi:hypothetical protein
MADIGSPQNWLVSKDVEVEKMWISVQIQEKKSRIVKTKQDIEDLMKGMKLKLEAQIIMLDKEILYLQQKRDSLTVQDV